MINPPAIVMLKHAHEVVTRQIQLFKSFDTEPEPLPNVVKLGVYVDGKLKLQTRDKTAIYSYAEKMMNKQHEVWVAPVGSFVDDKKRKAKNAT